MEQLWFVPFKEKIMKVICLGCRVIRPWPLEIAFLLSGRSRGLLKDAMKVLQSFTPEKPKCDSKNRK